ncbi:hypothetical protein [Luteolibacter marinus]|uniref:hypothetical protein n=1 Tax=Luteolibacter marinus TaxID=2776705 RepID=UPI0018660CFD|nr:hypothetical protein [Luteolibacter marinus]
MTTELVGLIHMTTRPFHNLLLPRIAVLLVLGALPSCAEPAAPVHGGAGTSPTQKSRPPEKRPDSSYRPPRGFTELQSVAGRVARASGHKIVWRLQPGANPGPLVRIRGTVNDCTIFVHPLAARKVPPNTWAFLFGHEFAHLTENLGTHSATSPENELQADITGARYAMAAGYRIEAFLGWVLTEPDQKSDSHGSLHQRVRAIARKFGVPWRTIERESKRAASYRAGR